MSVEDQNKAEIIENDGVDIIMKNIQGQNKEINMDLMWILRNISDQISQYEMVNSLEVLKLCIENLSSHNINQVIRQGFTKGVVDSYF